MSVYKRANSPYWYFDATVGDKRKRVSTETKDRRLAEQIEAEYRSRVLRGDWFAERPRLSLEAAFIRYWNDHAKRLPSAYQTHLYLRRFLEMWGAKTFMDQVNDDMVARYVSARLSDEIAPGTINRELRAVKAIFNTADKRWGVQTGNRVLWANHKQIEPDDVARYLTREEAVRLMDASPPHLKAAIRFAVMTGVRLANVVGVTWQQVDWEAGVITFRVKSKRPGGKLHTVPLTASLEALLKEMGPKPEGHLITFNGKPIKKLSKAFDTARKKAGLPDVRFHDLRHTAASWLLQGGAGLDLVKDMLGHSDIKMTMRYAKRQKVAVRQAMESSLSL